MKALLRELVVAIALRLPALVQDVIDRVKGRKPAEPEPNANPSPDEDPK